MSNPEYENKVSPTELYNDEIIQQFEAIRQVIHKEILPSTYNELVITSNQAGTLSNFMDIKSYPQSEIIFPLSPQSGNINWLDKNYIRLHFTIQETVPTNGKSMFGVYPPDSYWTNVITDEELTQAAYVSVGPIDGASIFKSIELNYAGTSIWTSAYQQVEAFCTYASLPTQISTFSTQFWSINKSLDQYPYCFAEQYGNIDDGDQTYNFDFYLDIDVSRISPILSWLTLIPSFCNKLTLRCIIDAPFNWLCKRYYIRLAPSYFANPTLANSWFSTTDISSSYMPLTEGAASSKSTVKWRVDLCEIHQNNATMTEDTRIRLIALIQQLGGKWIYPVRYWNTAIAPIQTIASTSNGNVNLQFVLTGCYFRALTFCSQIQWVNLSEPTRVSAISCSPGNGIFVFPFNSTSYEVYCDSELLVSYPNLLTAIQDTTSALMDEDKYNISTEISQSLQAWNNPTFSNGRMAFTVATGPPNGLYSGKYTSEKMGTHNILLKFKLDGKAPDDYNLFCWCSALQDGVIVFDNFNGSYFNTARRMQQVYEALS